MPATLRLAYPFATQRSLRAARLNRSLDAEAAQLIGRALVASDDDGEED